jgi:hypothetical protein
MEDRGEAPGGMAGVIRSKTWVQPHYGTAPAQKKRPMARFPGREAKTESRNRALSQHILESFGN